MMDAYHPQQLSTYALTLFEHTADIDGKKVKVGIEPVQNYCNSCRLLGYCRSRTVQFDASVILPSCACLHSGIRSYFLVVHVKSRCLMFHVK